MSGSVINVLSHQEFVSLWKSRSADLDSVLSQTEAIIEDVRSRGDDALLEYAQRFDGFKGSSFFVSEDRIRAAVESTEDALLKAIEVSVQNVAAFAILQMPNEFQVETQPGLMVGQIVRPISSACCYVPGGIYPLPSTAVMTCVPAKVAGVSDVIVSTPRPDNTIFSAASLAGADRVALLGGAHAIAAFALGTESIPKVDRIVGPGSKYVAAAKRLLSGEVGIDFVAGPTEVVIVASEGDPAWVASDLLAQAEHDVDAGAALVTTSRSFGEAVAQQVLVQLETLPTRQTAEQSLARYGAIVVCDSDQEAMDVVAQIAPEHLCIHDEGLLPLVRNAGGVFLGSGTPEALGDYIAGPNHVLPTCGAARLHGGLSCMDFLKVISVQQASPIALEALVADGSLLARSEGLEGHARSMEIRLAREASLG